MGLESATYISGLVNTNPVANDAKSQGDDHLRLIKATLLNTFPAITGAVTPTHTELNYVDGVTSAIQTQIDSKAAHAGQAYTGAHDFSGASGVTLPAATSVGTVSATEIGYVDGVTSAIQTQLDAKAAHAGQAYTGTQNFTGATTTVATQVASDNSTKAASTAQVQAAITAAVIGVGAVTLGANTFTGSQTIANTGALNTSRVTVASHATTADIWTAGNQIDWTGTATTTAFPAAPQAGVERVLICDGACSFTAGANLLIDGVSSGNSVTCAANDKVIVRAESTTKFHLTRHKYDGTAQVVASTGNHEVYVTTSNGYGSTNTKIPRFTTEQTNVGTAITYADSASDGAAFTIVTTGIYSMEFTGWGNGADYGISVNSNQLTTNIGSITAAHRVAIGVNPTSAIAMVSAVEYLTAADVVRPHTQGTAGGGNVYEWFRIRRVG